MQSDRIDWGLGKLVYWDLECLNEAIPLNSQIEYLKEDLAQISFPNKTIIDIGWYPEFDPGGRFVIVVIKDGEWETPLFRGDAGDIATLHQQMAQAIDVAA